MFPSTIKSLLKKHLHAGAFSIIAKGYDNDAICAYMNQRISIAVISIHPSKAKKTPFDQYHYRERSRLAQALALLR